MFDIGANARVIDFILVKLSWPFCFLFWSFLLVSRNYESGMHTHTFPSAWIHIARVAGSFFLLALLRQKTTQVLFLESPCSQEDTRFLSWTDISPSPPSSFSNPSHRPRTMEIPTPLKETPYNTESHSKSRHSSRRKPRKTHQCNL